MRTRAMRLAASALDLDERLLRLAASWGARPGTGETMRLVSRLGDGPAWYAVGIVALPCHALHAFAWATLIALRFGALGPPAFAFAALIGLSRVALAVHYPSDVLAGGVIGTVLALLIAAAV